MATFSLAGETFELITSSKMTFAESRAFERAAGFPWVDVLTDERAAKSAAAEQALLWISMKRVKPEMKFSDLDDLPIGDIDWSTDEDEAPAEDGAEESPDPTQAEA